jgi:hypothetical protein
VYSAETGECRLHEASLGKGTSTESALEYRVLTNDKRIKTSKPQGKITITDRREQHKQNNVLQVVDVCNIQETNQPCSH